MRKKVNIKIPESDLDYGVKPYAAPTAYQGQVRKATSQLEHNNVVRQYSEFKRPQGGHDSYNDMEHWADPPPGFVFPDFPLPDIPGTEFPVPDFEWGDSFICMCGGDTCYCPGQITCFAPNCTYPIIGVSLSTLTGGFENVGKKSGFNLFSTKNRLCISAPSDAKGSIEVTYTLQKYKPDGKGGVTKAGTCQTSNIYSQCQPSKCCAETEAMAWDDETSAETIAQGNSCVVAITDSGDGSPYTWSVSGTGFWFNSGYSVTSMQTNNKVAVLYTDAEACGPATITVTGCAGQVVTGHVRCTAGLWVRVGICFESSLPFGIETYCGSGGCTVINGKFRYDDQWVASIACGSSCHEPENPGACGPPHCTITPGFGSICWLGFIITCEWMCTLGELDPCL